MSDSELSSEIPVRARYEQIDANNDASWYMTRARGFETYQSVGTVKPSAALFGEQVRKVLAGNMSELYPKTGDMTDDEKYTAALGNMMRFYASIGLSVGDMLNTVILYPQREYGVPLKVVNVDEFTNQSSFIEPMIALEKGDFMYTRDPNRILAARPADCPIVLATADTPEGRTMMLTHFAWEGAASGFIDDMFDTYDQLGVDRDSLQLYVTPGGQAESFPYTNFGKYDPLEKFPGTEDLFKKYKKNDDGTFDFNVDTPHFLYQELLKRGLKPEQIYADTSDTSSLESGYSSNGRAMRSGGEETNIRDIILAKMNNIILNPERLAPPEIAEKIKPVRVRYIGFDGKTHDSTIEIHEDLAEDIEAFFEAAFEMGFPIERVVRSSDAEFSWDDDKLMAANSSSGFNYRLIKGTDRPSLHGLGRALDINTRVNPYVRYKDGEQFVDPAGAEYDPSAPGALSADHPLVDLMRERGWVWGGDWTEEANGVTDYQHFDKRA